MSNPRINMLGVRQGKLTVIKYAGRNKHNEATWLCKCDCGKEIVVRGGHLREGQKACQQCALIEKNKSSAKHHMSRSKLYNTYYAMLKRCYTPSCASYGRYGGRGISVCDEWRNAENGFLNFAKWANSHGYSEDLSIDRIDVDKGYSPDNCRWVTMAEQASNRSNTPFVTYNGETHALSEWAKKLDIPRKNLYCRLKSGWSVDRAFSTPVKGRWSNAKKEEISKTP